MRQTDRQTETERDRQTDRDRDKERQRETETLANGILDRFKDERVRIVLYVWFPCRRVDILSKLVQ